MTGLDERSKRIRERGRLVYDLIPRTPRVRVVPRDAFIREHLTHPNEDVKFPTSGAVEWPLDNFTQRRLRDGTVSIEGEVPFNAAHPRAAALSAAERAKFDSEHHYGAPPEDYYERIVHAGPPPGAVEQRQRMARERATRPTPPTPPVKTNVD